MGFYFKHPKYWGASVIPDSYDNNFILNLSGYELSDSKASKFTVNASINQYIFFCIPSSWGAPIFNVGGFDGGFYKITELNFTNKSGYAETYAIWRSDNQNLGSQIITVK